MEIKVVDTYRDLKVIQYSDFDSYVFLVRDGWNDFGFRTQYQMYLSSLNTRELDFIGDVKILKKDQSSSDGFGGKGILRPRIMGSLGDNFCSLGQSFDYYQRLAERDENVRDEVLKLLNDVVFDASFISLFSDTEGWSTSLLRGFGDGSEHIGLSRMILFGDCSQLPEDDLEIRFKTKGLKGELSFNFEAKIYEEGQLAVEFPSRISVLVGKNGCGKSTLISRLAKLAFSSEKYRSSKSSFLSKVGDITPNDIGFMKVITVSYSGFDAFQIPGVTYEEKKAIVNEMASGNGRFVFCGMRDIKKENEGLFLSDSDDKSGFLPEKAIVGDRQDLTVQKSIMDLNDEVAECLERIDSLNRNKIIIRALSFTYEFMEGEGIKKDPKKYMAKIRESFPMLSTGHKFVVHALLSLVAQLKNRCLVLFDEPENHLHPPLLAAFMKSVRFLLNEYKSYGVVATHSPVVLQETLSCDVTIVRREGKKYT